MEQPVGLVLCGGKSSRLRQDKSQINYHGAPQWQFLAGMLSELCPKVIVSCSYSQAAQYSREVEGTHLANLFFCVDQPALADSGPVSGVLSAFETVPATDLLVIGCDYPLIKKEDLEFLLSSRKPGTDAVCYHLEKENLDLPFPAIYERSIQKILLNLFHQGKYSLREGLREGNVLRLTPPHPERLISANTPEEVERMKARISQQA